MGEGWQNEGWRMSFSFFLGGGGSYCFLKLIQSDIIELV